MMTLMMIISDLLTTSTEEDDDDDDDDDHMTCMFTRRNSLLMPIVHQDEQIYWTYWPWSSSNPSSHFGESFPL